MRLLFVSNLFPDTQEPYRGLDNATLLHALSERAEVHTLALRPVLPWSRRSWSARLEDSPLRPRFLRASYIPRFGHRWNHLLYARSMHRVFTAMLRAERFDAVLASWLFPDACAVARLLRASTERFVAIAQGTDAHHYLGIPPRRRIIARELGRAQAIVTRSAELARLLQEAGLPAERLHPVYNGVDLTRFRPAAPAERLAARQALGIPHGVPVILFVGNFLPVKNPALLLNAHAQVAQAPGLGETHLILVGGGLLEAEMRAQVATAGTSRLVKFAGRQSADGVARAMQAADVLALSSWNEGVPNVVLEAFASGLPVVATRVGGIAEVLDSERIGLLSPAGDAAALARALEDVLLNKRDPAVIATHGRCFSWQRAAGNYLELLSPEKR